MHKKLDPSAFDAIGETAAAAPRPVAAVLLQTVVVVLAVFGTAIAPQHRIAIAVAAAAVVLLAGLAAGRSRGAGRRGPRADTVAAGPDTAARSAAGRGDGALLRQVLPVWQRQIDATRELADKTAIDMLGTFGGISDGLEKALNAAEMAASGLGTHALDDLVADQQEAIEGMLAPLTAATRARQDMRTLLETTSGRMAELRARAQVIRSVARRTHIVALNASVEATRGGGGSGGESAGSGFNVVAQEIRLLARQSTDAGAAIVKIAHEIEAELRRLQAREGAADTADAELRAQSEQCVRSIVGALIKRLGETSQSSRGLREAGSAVRSDVEQAMVNFQAQDRMSQMLGAIVDDIARMNDWLAEGNDQSAAMAAEWLKRLDASYTMEDQRSQHHGHAAIERSASVEFF